MFVNHSTIARWESGSRLPDAAMTLRLAKCLGVDPNTLFQLTAQSDESPNVIMVDDSKVILTQGLTVLEETMPNAAITGFIWPLEAIEYAKMNRIALAFLDIELGTASGLDLCRTLLEINPRTNIVFLTAYADYSLDAWKTEASGFLLKPLTPEGVKEQLQKLRYPFSTGGADE
jgi:DNA-binding LytR/AlgR family response regulator